jgi:hypothetical protein
VPHADDWCKDCRVTPTPSGRRRCEQCAAAHALRERERRAKRRKAKTCPACGAKPSPGNLHCEACLAYWLGRRTRAKRAQLLAGQKGSLAPGRRQR